MHPPSPNSVLAIRGFDHGVPSAKWSLRYPLLPRTTVTRSNVEATEVSDPHETNFNPQGSLDSTSTTCWSSRSTSSVQSDPSEMSRSASTATQYSASHCGSSRVKPTPPSAFMVENIILSPKDRFQKSPGISPRHRRKSSYQLVKEQETPQERQDRRRKRRHATAMGAGTAGAIMGGVLLGPIGFFAGGLGAGVVVTAALRRGEKRKDDRMARQSLKFNAGDHQEFV